MAQHPLAVIQEKDPAFFDHLSKAHRFVFSDGALTRKTKLLMALAFDAAHGAARGVEALSQQALQAGAGKEEILESLRVAYLLSGVGSAYTAAQALEGVL
jgi:alkylhydroperoxidase/carboxymuconolactone decarboxylase family protein YurZ